MHGAALRRRDRRGRHGGCAAAARRARHGRSPRRAPPPRRDRPRPRRRRARRAAGPSGDWRRARRSKPSASRMRAASAAGTSTPPRAATRSGRSVRLRRQLGISPAATTWLASPPQSSRISRAATSAPHWRRHRIERRARSGSAHRTRCRACGRSRRCGSDRTAPPRGTRRWWSRQQPDVLAAHDAADAVHGLGIGDDRHARVERVGPAVERQDHLARAGQAHGEIARELGSASKTCSGRPRSKVT